MSERLPTVEARAALAARASYGGYGKHKRNPWVWGLEPFHGLAPDRTFCEDAEFAFADQRRIPDLLRRGIVAGLFGDLEAQGDPTMLWTVDDSGWIYELRLTNPGQALYHDYPMLPSNALGRQVIARFAGWIDELPRIVLRREPALRIALRASQDFYN